MFNESNFESKPSKGKEFILNLIFENIELTDRNIKLAHEVDKLKKEVDNLKKSKVRSKEGNDKTNNIYIVFP